MVVIDQKRCIKCGGCVSVCPFDALELRSILQCNEKCMNCGVCVKFCPVGALKVEG